MKGHSDRIPGKNMKSFAGKPLYHQIAETLMGSRFISRIIINTDARDIQEDVEHHFPEIKVIVRPKDICGDRIPMNRIIQHDLKQLDGDHFLQTHSTNPLLRATTLDKAINTYFSNLHRHDSLFSVTAHQTRFYDTDGNPINHDPSKLLPTQELTPVYEENSCLFVFSRSSFGKSGYRRIGVNPLPFVMNKLEAVDIDNAEDFMLAECLFMNKDKWISPG